MVTRLAINIQLLEPEVRIPDGAHPDPLVTNLLLYSIAVSMKKIRELVEDGRFTQEEVFKRMINE